MDSTIHGLGDSMSASLGMLLEHCYASAYRVLENGDEVGAQRLFGIMATLSPHDERAWIGLAIIRERNEQWRAAAGLYGVGAALAPNAAWCHFGKARALMHLGRAAEAETAFQLAESLTQDAALLDSIEKERSAS